MLLFKESKTAEENVSHEMQWVVDDRDTVGIVELEEIPVRMDNLDVEIWTLWGVATKKIEKSKSKGLLKICEEILQEICWQISHIAPDIYWSIVIC